MASMFMSKSDVAAYQNKTLYLNLKLFLALKAKRYDEAVEILQKIFIIPSVPDAFKGVLFTFNVSYKIYFSVFLPW